MGNTQECLEGETGIDILISKNNTVNVFWNELNKDNSRHANREREKNNSRPLRNGDTGRESLPQVRTHQLASPENKHARKIKQTEQGVFRNLYVYTHT